MNKLNLAIIILAIALVGSSANAFYYINTLAQNDTETVATGQEVVEVETPTGQVEEAAPAESISTLLNTIFVVAVPAIISLILTIISLVKVLPLKKNQVDTLNTAETGLKYIDAMAPKIAAQFVESGATTTAINLILDKLDEIKPGIKEEVSKTLKPVPQINQELRETSAQINKLREEITPSKRADADKNLPRTIDKTVK